MRKASHRCDRKGLSCKLYDIVLAFIWLLGLWYGRVATQQPYDYLVPLIQRAVGRPMSLGGLFLVDVLPVLLSALAVRFCPSGLLVLCLFRAFGFSYCVHAVYIVFDGFTWLICPLFLFSEFLLSPVLYLYWSRNIIPVPSHPTKDLVICIVFAMIVGLTDHWIVSPFVAGLL